MSIDKLKQKFSTGAFISDVKHYFPKINEIIDYLNNQESKILKGLLTNTPEIIELKNNLGICSITKVGTGHYTVTSSSLFTLGKTLINVSSVNIINSQNITYYQTDDSNIEIYTFDNTNSLTDDILSEDNSYCNIIIEVFN